jgi:hypothetical protein
MTINETRKPYQIVAEGIKAHILSGIYPRGAGSMPGLATRTSRP